MNWKALLGVISAATALLGAIAAFYPNAIQSQSIVGSKNVQVSGDHNSIVISDKVAENIATKPMQHSDGRGHVWTPDGIYENSVNGTLAELHVNNKESRLDAGNGCQLYGRLSRVNGEPVYKFIVGERDGRVCPDVFSATITILDGPAVTAHGNASRVKITQEVQQGFVDYSGEYEYKY